MRTRVRTAIARATHQLQALVKRLGVRNRIGHGSQRRRSDLFKQTQRQPLALLAESGVAHPGLVQRTRSLRQGTRLMELIVN